MPSVDDVIERVRASAGADFAFILTLRGRLVTRDAPADMPEVGRERLVAASREIDSEHGVAEVEMPREELVPYGGAAPVDVFVAVAGDQAVVCVVMATWADKKAVFPAIVEGLEALEPMIASAAKRRKASGKRRVPLGAPAPPEARTGGTARPPAPAEGTDTGTGMGTATAKSTAPPSKGKRGALAGLLQMSAADTAASGGLRRAPAGAAIPGSLPEIRVSEAHLGQASLEAIEREGGGGLPRPAAMPDLGFTPGIGSMPDVRVELASIGRATEAEILREEQKRQQSLAAMPDHLIAPAMTRATQPWVEEASATKRASDAARTGRKVSPPKVTVKLEDADDDTFEALLLDDVPDADAAPVPGTPPPPPDGGEPASSDRRPPQSSLEVWRDGLAEATEVESRRETGGKKR